MKPTTSLLPVTVALCSAGFLASAADAWQIETTIEIPRLPVAEYHRPYVALWIESLERREVHNLSVWYDLAMRDNEGATWLKDLRQWWRKSGRALDLPVDGVSAPTRPPGKHHLVFGQSSHPLSALPHGSYQFVVEAAREVGGRELITIPFEWTGQALPPLVARGERELGEITFTLTPSQP